MIQSFYYIFSVVLLYCIYTAFGEKCDSEDQECIKSAVQRIYPYIINGNDSLGVDSSEPLVKDKIVGIVPTLNYTLTDIYMYGISGCEIMEAKFRISDQIWHLYIVCPSLTLKMHYQLDGYVAAEKLFGEGDSQMVFDTYHISFNGGLRIEMRDGREFIQLVNFDFTRIGVTGKIYFQFNNLFDKDEERSKKMNKFLNDHGQELNRQGQLPTMYGMMGVLIDHFNQYLNKVPVDEAFSKA